MSFTQSAAPFPDARSQMPVPRCLFPDACFQMPVFIARFRMPVFNARFRDACSPTPISSARLLANHPCGLMCYYPACPALSACMPGPCGQLPTAQPPSLGVPVSDGLASLVRARSSQGDEVSPQSVAQPHPAATHWHVPQAQACALTSGGLDVLAMVWPKLRRVPQPQAGLMCWQWCDLVVVHDAVCL